VTQSETIEANALQQHIYFCTTFYILQTVVSPLWDFGDCAKALRMGRKLSEPFAGAGRYALFLTLVLLPGCKTSPHQGASWRPDTASEEQRTVLSAYDNRLCDAIGTRWLQLLEERKVPQDHGRVVVGFELYSDGHIAETRVIENTEGQVFGWLCHKAITDPVPYESWPSELRSLFTKPRRFRVWFEFDVRGESRVTAVEVPRRPTGPLERDSETVIAIYLPEERNHGLFSPRLSTRKIFTLGRNSDSPPDPTHVYYPYREPLSEPIRFQGIREGSLPQSYPSRPPSMPSPTFPMPR
jgi:hypothetical protein